MPEQPADELDELRSFGQALGGEPRRVGDPSPRPVVSDRGRSAAARGRARCRRSRVDAPVVSLESRRRSRVLWMVGAAAALLIAVAAGVVLTTSSDEGTVLASTELERLGDTGQGSAKIVDRNGSLQLRLDTTDVEPTDGFTEVWLINAGVTELISLGPIRSDGTYDLPAGLDPVGLPDRRRLVRAARRQPAALRRQCPAGTVHLLTARPASPPISAVTLR